MSYNNYMIKDDPKAGNENDDNDNNDNAQLDTSKVPVGFFGFFTKENKNIRKDKKDKKGKKDIGKDKEIDKEIVIVSGGPIVPESFEIVDERVDALNVQNKESILITQEKGNPEAVNVEGLINQQEVAILVGNKIVDTEYQGLIPLEEDFIKRTLAEEIKKKIKNENLSLKNWETFKANAFKANTIGTSENKVEVGEVKEVNSPLEFLTIRQATLDICTILTEKDKPKSAMVIATSESEDVKKINMKNSKPIDPRLIPTKLVVTKIGDTTKMGFKNKYGFSVLGTGVIIHDDIGINHHEESETYILYLRLKDIVNDVLSRLEESCELDKNDELIPVEAEIATKEQEEILSTTEEQETQQEEILATTEEQETQEEPEILATTEEQEKQQEPEILVTTEEQEKQQETEILATTEEQEKQEEPEILGTTEEQEKQEEPEILVTTEEQETLEETEILATTEEQEKQQEPEILVTTEEQETQEEPEILVTTEEQEKQQEPEILATTEEQEKQQEPEILATTEEQETQQETEILATTEEQETQEESEIQVKPIVKMLEEIEKMMIEIQTEELEILELEEAALKSKLEEVVNNRYIPTSVLEYPMGYVEY